MSPTRIIQSILIMIVIMSFAFTQGNVAKEFKRLNAKVNRERVRIDSLETEIRILLPDLRNTLHATVKAKQQTDSVAIMLINRMNTLQKKIINLEDKVAYIDSTNFEILAQLVMIENKIITLTSSFTEMYSLKSGDTPASRTETMSPAEYKKKYIESLSSYQNGAYQEAIDGFTNLVVNDPMNELADNSQYWLAECYYSLKNYKRAVKEFEKVFTFPGTDKDDDAQLKLGLAHQSMGNLKKAHEEYQRLVDYFPGSEYYEKAKETLKQLNIE